MCSVEIVKSARLLAPLSRESESLMSKEEKKKVALHSSICTAVQRGLTRNQKQKQKKPKKMEKQ